VPAPPAATVLDDHMAGAATMRAGRARHPPDARPDRP
jgi:hypothetical protein